MDKGPDVMGYAVSAAKKPGISERGQAQPMYQERETPRFHEIAPRNKLLGRSWLEVHRKRRQERRRGKVLAGIKQDPSALYDDDNIRLT
jgi:hypothetical protein